MKSHHLFVTVATATALMVPLAPLAPASAIDVLHSGPAVHAAKKTTKKVVIAYTVGPNKQGTISALGRVTGPKHELKLGVHVEVFWSATKKGEYKVVAKGRAEQSRQVASEAVFHFNIKPSGGYTYAKFLKETTGKVEVPKLPKHHRR